MAHSESTKNIRVRFAPSPTGYLHIGGVRTALFNWLYAAHHKGRFILRIEDTDIERSAKESIDMIIEGLQWLGINWDEGPYLQTDKRGVYEKHTNRLLSEGKAYKCYCTQDELEEMRKSAMARGEKPQYDGRCRQRNKEQPDKPYVIRFKTPSEGKLDVHDLIRGEISFDNSQLDDLIIMRSNKTPTYNFVVVVDDAEMNITHVIRGDDHLANTPRQIHLYNGLGYTAPKFAHLPMILGSDKARLSKRHGASSVLEYRDTGYLPEAIINYLARLGWSHGDQEIFSTDELIAYFDLDHINNSPAVFNPEKLIWLNSHYIKTSSPSYVAKSLKNHLINQDIIKDTDGVSQEEIEKVVPCLQERSKTLIEMAKGMEFYFREISGYDEKGIRKFFTPETLPVLNDLLVYIEDCMDINEESLNGIFNILMEKTGLKLGKIAQPARLALTGKTVSPGIFDVIILLGKKKTVSRLKKAIEFINGVK